MFLLLVLRFHSPELKKVRKTPVRSETFVRNEGQIGWVDVSLGKEMPLAQLFPKGIKMTRVLLILRRGISVLAVGLVIASFGTATFADDLYGRIRGVVNDSSGGAVADVQVTATNVDTGVAKTVTSGADGSFEFLQLAAPGNYSVQVERKGFKTYRVGAIHLKLNQIYVLNVALDLGAVTENVLVRADQAEVETTSIQLGRDIGADTVVDLPLNGRNWVQLQQTLPGVVAASDRFGTNYATNGGRSQANSYLVNGTDANDLPLNSLQIIPNPDAIAEVNLITNTINPEYGRNGGAILNATTKSGTNQFHGDVFEFFRDTGLNTRNFFSRNTTVFHRNQFGGTIGGPFVKDKLFGFFSYQGTRARQPQPGAGGTTTVFTSAERSGNFSNGSGTSPFTGSSAVPLVGESGQTFAARTPYSQIFPTGNIPSVDLNPISVNLTNRFVPPPTTGTTFEFNPIRPETTDQYLGRVDYNLSKRDTIWGYFFVQPNSNTDTLPFTGSTLPGFTEQSRSRSQQYTVAYLHTFGGNTINEARFGYQRFNFLAVQPVNPTLPSSAGFNISPQDPAGAGLPFISVTGLFNLGFSTNGPQPRIDQTYQFTDNYSKIIGRHALKFGFEMRRSQVENPFFFNNNGAFTFAGAGTFSTGSPGADFLLGVPDSFAQSSGGFIDARTQTYYSYAQDQFKFRPNLTITYGIGWQIDTPLSDVFNRGLSLNCFRPGQQSTVFPSAPTGLIFPGDRGCNEAGGVTTKFKDFGPRFGFAWSPFGSSKTSVRAGYGIYYNRTEEELALQNLVAPPVSLSTGGIANVGGSPSFANPFQDIQTGRTITSPFPFAPPRAGAAVDFSQFEPFSLNVFDPRFAVPYSQNYNLTVERELPGQFVLSVGYVGSVGHRLTKVVEGNPAGNESGNPICLATPGCNAFNNFQTAPQSFRFPQTNANGLLTFGSIGTQETTGNSNYNSLQIVADKHLSHGLTFRATYTLSHSLDSASSFEDLSNGLGADPFNPRRDYGNSTFDARNRFVVNYTYDFPNTRFEGLRGRIFNGYRLSGITTLQGGFPISIFDGGFRSLTCDATFSFFGCFDRPNFNGAAVQTFDPRTGSVANTINPARPLASQNNYFFNPNGFTREALGTLGNAGRNFFNGPGLNNFDFAVHKDTRVSEATKLELRIEFFNLFNHANFNPVSSNGGVNGNSNSRNFGRILDARPSGIDSRLIQLVAKFNF